MHGSVHKAMNQLLGDLHRSRQQRKKLTESVFEVPMGAGSAPVRVLLREKHGACLGTSLWASSEVLTEYLGAHHLPALGERVQGMRVLELGCGIGLPGIFCALQGCSVTLTDQEEVCWKRTLSVISVFLLLFVLFCLFGTPVPSAYHRKSLHALAQVLGITRENVSANRVDAEVVELLWGSLPTCTLVSLAILSKLRGHFCNLLIVGD